MSSILYICGLGVLGILSRYGIDQWVASSGAPTFQGTLVINILGSVLAGAIFVWGEKSLLNPALQVGLLVGFCGGFTTFSAYSLQVFQLLEKDRLWMGLSYLVMSPILGVLAAALSVHFLRKI